MVLVRRESDIETHSAMSAAAILFQNVLASKILTMTKIIIQIYNNILITNFVR